MVGTPLVIHPRITGPVPHPLLDVPPSGTDAFAWPAAPAAVCDTSLPVPPVQWPQSCKAHGVSVGPVHCLHACLLPVLYSPFWLNRTRAESG